MRLRSSYHETIDKRASPDWLETDALLLMFVKKYKNSHKKIYGICGSRSWYCCLHNLKNQVFTGDKDFVERHQAMLEDDVDITLSEMPKKQKQINIQPISFFRDKYHDDKLAMASAYLDGCYKMAEIAVEFGVHYSTVSRAVAKCKS